MPANKSRWFLLLMIFVFFGNVFAVEPYSEQYVLEPFIGACGGGPSTGPAVYNTNKIINTCSDAKGNLYGVGGNMILMIDTVGNVSQIGNVNYGYYDGKAVDAAYKLGAGYYGSWNMSCSPGGDLFIDDGANACVRRVFKTDSCWMTETWAGGGTGVLANVGDSAPAKSISLKNGIIAQCNSRGEVIIHTYYHGKIYKVSADGATIKYLAPLPVADANNYLATTTCGASADTLGNVYFLNRGTQCLYKVTADGQTTVLCGSKGGVRHDTLTLYRYIWMPWNVVAAPDGTCCYVSGGDTDFIVRVPTDTSQSTASLGRNGRFYCTSVEQNPDRSTAGRSIDTTLAGPLLPDGTLKMLFANTMSGDRKGNLYVGFHSWNAFYYEGMSTQLSKLRKVR